MRRPADREDHGDHASTHTLAADPITHPAASSTVEVGCGNSDLAHTWAAAVEMPVPWKSQNDFHRTVEISHSTRDSHISTSRFHFEEENKTRTKDQRDK